MGRILIGILLLCFTACTGGGHSSHGVKFAPAERKSNLSEAERTEAIAKKRIELAGINMDTLLFRNNVKLTILSPKPEAEITMQVSLLAQSKLIEIACQNGISGLGNDPIFVLAMTMNPLQKGLTSTVPQLKSITYAVNLYVGNVLTDEIYANTSLQLMGVGDTEEGAAANAVTSMENTQQLQLMLQKSADRIVHWYDNHVETFTSKVEQAVAQGDYAMAHALLSSVPEESTHCFAYATSKRGFVFNQLQHQQRESNLIQMKNAIAEAGEQYDPQVAAYYRMIPADCAQKAEADLLYNRYVSSIASSTQSAVEHQRFWEHSEVELRKMQVQAEIEASRNAIMQAQALSMSQMQPVPVYSEEAPDEQLSMRGILTRVVNLTVEQIPNLLGLLI